MNRSGLVQGAFAYAWWGVAAVYWRLVASVAPVEVIAHRAIWGMFAFGAIALIAGEGAELRATLHQPRRVAVMALSGGVLAVNWVLFVWAAVSGHLLDASLGYFINPLLSVALGTLVLGERLSRLQWIAIALATIGVALMTWRLGHIPWISVLLALTFALYGLIRKTAPVRALAGSTIETMLMVPIAIGYLAVRHGGVAIHAAPSTLVVLVCSGAVTAIPLALFTSAARVLPLSVLGFLQYLAPTGQFLLAVLVYGEPLAHERLLAFVWIWAGLAVFSIDLVIAGRARAR